MDNQEFQRENLKELIVALGITIGTRTFKPPHKPMQLQLHQYIAVNWMPAKHNRRAKVGLLADDCRIGKVGPCSAPDIQFAIPTIIRL